MPNLFFSPNQLVKNLTLLSVVFMLACTPIHSGRRPYSNYCKNHAYTQLVLEDYLSRRYASRSPIRLGIVPFSVPANFASESSLRPGVDSELAWMVHQKLLATGEIPIVEVFNRIDWPGKPDEFFTGNFGALSFGQQANYDLLLIGYVPPPQGLQDLSAYVKLIEVESGITIYYSQDNVYKTEGRFQRTGSLLFGEDRPDILQFEGLLDELSGCIVDGLLGTEPTP